jgi:hypothetical protein
VNAQSKLGFVVTSRQLLVAQVAVAACSSVTEQMLGQWEDHRVDLGSAYDSLARRLRAAREMDDASGARLVDLLDDEGHPMVALALELSAAESSALRVAVDRLRGILARTGDFDGQLDEDLDAVTEALG